MRRTPRVLVVAALAACGAPARGPERAQRQPTRPGPVMVAPAAMDPAALPVWAGSRPGGAVTVHAVGADPAGIAVTLVGDGEMLVLRHRERAPVTGRLEAASTREAAAALAGVMGEALLVERAAATEG